MCSHSAVVEASVTVTAEKSISKAKCVPGNTQLISSALRDLRLAAGNKLQIGAKR